MYSKQQYFKRCQKSTVNSWMTLKKVNNNNSNTNNKIYLSLQSATIINKII